MKSNPSISTPPPGAPGILSIPRDNKTDGAVTRRHIRGSSLLLIGRIIALTTNFLVQVLAVRYLAKQEYGAFAYAISVIAMTTLISLMGLNKGLSRFVPIYHEKGDVRTMFGVIFLAFGGVAGLGVAMILLTIGLQGFLASTVVSDPLCVSLLVIMIAMAPLQALDELSLGLLASFQKARSILLRRYVLGPVLKLAAVLLVIASGGNVQMLATGYLLGGIIGTSTYLALIRSVLRGQGLLERLDLKKVRLPVRELFGFSLPLISVDLFYIFLSSVSVIILEHFRGPLEVAEYRAVVPVAGLNLVVHQSLKPLFTPVASRLFARNDKAGVSDIYWQSALWVTILTFPVFAVCSCLSDPVTVLLFGQRYASAGTYLAILAFGNFFNAALGLNVDTLQVYGRVRFIIGINFVATAATLIANLVVIPRYGALGAAWTTASSVVFYNLLNHAGLLWKTGVDLFQWRYLKVYLLVAAISFVLLLLRWTLGPPPWAMGIAIVLAALLLARWSRQSLDLGRTFPELGKIPLLGKLLTGGEVKHG